MAGRNMSGKNNTFYGKKHTLETRAKMVKNHKGMTGQKMPEWFKERMRNRTGIKNPRTGTHWSKEHKEYMSRKLRGRPSKLGQHKTNGYIHILTVNHPYADSKNYVKRSHLVMEKYIGRYIEPQEVIHHINGMKDDDRLENLELFSNQSKHNKSHWNSFKSTGTKGRFRKR